LAITDFSRLIDQGQREDALAFRLLHLSPGASDLMEQKANSIRADV
jgi:hypothetical protein